MAAPQATARVVGARPGRMTVTLAPLPRGMGHTLGPMLHGALATTDCRVDVGVRELPAVGAVGHERLALDLRADGAAPQAALATLATGAARLQHMLDGVIALLPSVPMCVTPLFAEGFVPRWTTGPDPVLAQPIDVLDLSVRARNCLRAEGIGRIGDLLACTETDLLRTPNLGRRCLQEIKAALAGYGLVLPALMPGRPAGA